MKKQLAKLALTAALGLALTLTLSCGNHSWEEILGLDSSSSEQEDNYSSSSFKLSSSSGLRQSSSSSSLLQSGVVYGDPVTYQGETYQTVVIGKQTWFQRNLNYAVEGSKCYDNDPANCQKYGRLYYWEDAMKACPSGWHLPSYSWSSTGDSDWDELRKYVNSDNGCSNTNKPGTCIANHLNAKNGWNGDDNGTDTYGFSALPGGYGDPVGGFKYVGSYGYYWSTEEIYANDAFECRISNNGISISNSNKAYLYSVRCVQGPAKPRSSSSSSKLSSSSQQQSIVSGTLTDSRDGKKYKTAKIGEQTWMAENINYDATGKCYDNDPANCTKYGRLYNWEAAKTVCPAGWHLPSNADWNVLMNFVNPRCYNNSSCANAGKILMATNGWNDYGGKSCKGTDNYGFSALPGGCGYSDGSFCNNSIGNSGRWWSSSEFDNSDADTRSINCGTDAAVIVAQIKSNLYSVRCIQN